MNKGPGRPSGERTGEPSFISQIREQLEARKNYFAAVGEKPDFSDTWNSDEFKALPPDVQDSLKKEYGAPVEARASAEDGAKVDELREGLNARKGMFEAVSATPDYSDTWNTEEFRSLPANIQKQLRAEFPDAAPAAQARPKKEEPRHARQEQPPAVQPAKEVERKDERPKKRAFENYSIAPDPESGKFVVIENFKERDKNLDDYRAKKLRTTISIPDALVSALAADPGLAAEIGAFCGSLRESLDEKGVKIYIDRPDNEPEKVHPKWKYYLEKKMVEEPLKIEDFPPEIAELLKKNKQYFNDSAWKKWFGRAMQAKRDAIISSALTDWASERTPVEKKEKVEAVTDDMITGSETAEEVETPDLIEEEDRAEKEKELSMNAARTFAAELIMSSLELYTKDGEIAPPPELMEKFIEHLDRFAGSFLELHYRQRPSMPASARLSSQEVKDAVRDALRNHFADMPDVLASMPQDGVVERAVAAMPEPAKTVNVQAEMETKISPAYDTLRKGADRISSEVELDRFVAELAARTKDPDPEVRQAASTLLVEIDHGQIGPVSESRRAGLERSEEERDFFKEHPLLDRRNVELTNDGRTVIYLDKLHANDALSRAVRLLVLDALSPGEKEPTIDPEQDKVIEPIRTYIFKILGRRQADQDLARRFKDGVAELNFSNGELIIKGMRKLTDIIHKAAEYFRKNPPK